jgi:NAD(P)-dependent dehydrogenase (short-subunit alcohol dehydrogenase family)
MKKASFFYRGKVVLITGAASGIGAALARALSVQGAILVLADIDEPRLHALAHELGEGGARVLAARLDVSDEDAFRRLIERTVTEFTRLDTLINNAGFGITGELCDLSGEDWHDIRSVNLDGVVFGSMHAYRTMRIQRAGQIINVASMAALFAYPLHTLYAATKYAVLGFSATLRLEARDFGIQVNVVCPGPIDTPIFQTTRLVGLDRNKALSVFRYHRLPPHKAAAIILDRAARDEAIIICPARYRWLWRAARWAPWLLQPGLIKLLNNLRACRIDNGEA